MKKQPPGQHNTDDTERLLQVIDDWKWAAALALIAVLMGAYWGLPNLGVGGESLEFARSIITNLIPVFLVFVVSWKLFRTADGVRRNREHEQTVQSVAIKVRDELLTEVDRRPPVCHRFDVVPWSDMIRESESIDIIVHYFDSWVKTHHDALGEFFARGGALRILLPDPEDASALEQIRARFLETEQSGVSGKIQNTPRRIADIRKGKSNKGRLEVRFVKVPIWYCSLRFSRNVAALSPFESKRGVGVNAPCFVMRGVEANNFVEWFDKEFDHMWAMARPWMG